MCSRCSLKMLKMSTSDVKAIVGSCAYIYEQVLPCLLLSSYLVVLSFSLSCLVSSLFTLVFVLHISWPVSFEKWNPIILTLTLSLFLLKTECVPSCQPRYHQNSTGRKRCIPTLTILTPPPTERQRRQDKIETKTGRRQPQDKHKHND
jgi:hypothetical protein